MSIIQSKAQAVAEHMAAASNVTFIDPVTLGIIVEVLIAVVQLAYKCYEDHHKVSAAMRSPNWFARWLLRRTIASKIAAVKASTALAAPMLDGILAVGKTVADEEVVRIQAEMSAA